MHLFFIILPGIAGFIAALKLPLYFQFIMLAVGMAYLTSGYCLRKEIGAIIDYVFFICACIGAIIANIYFFFAFYSPSGLDIGRILKWFITP